MTDASKLTPCPPPSEDVRSDDVEGISEITVLPDGRVYVLGLSSAILDVLDRVGPWSGLSPNGRRRMSVESEVEAKENES